MGALLMGSTQLTSRRVWAILMVNSQHLKGIFLADILKRLLAAGFVEFGVNRGVNVGSECGLSVLDTSMVEEVALPVMVLDEEESLAVCDPLLTVIPPGWLCQLTCTMILRF